MSKAISLSTGPILTIFSPNRRYLREFSFSGPVFSIPQGTLPWQPILWQNCGKITYPPALIALSFRHGMGYHIENMHIYSSTNCSISCKNGENLFISFWVKVG